jgi:Predicted metal-binding protein related to the C-terminal domain of SecA
MSTRKISNVPLKDYRLFLTKAGCNNIRTKGGHEIWVRNDLTRPIVVQTHESPVPEFIIKNALRSLGLTTTDFFNILFGVEEKDNPIPEDDDIEKAQNDDDECYCGSGRKYKNCHGKIFQKKE